jgi:hypothetical protein
LPSFGKDLGGTQSGRAQKLSASHGRNHGVFRRIAEIWHSLSLVAYDISALKKQQDFFKRGEYIK